MAEVLKMRFLVRSRTAAAWTALNEVLLASTSGTGAREMGMEEDTGKFKLGDGVSAWNDLPYQNAGGAATPMLVNVQTGTSYTLVAGDAGGDVQCGNAAPVTITIPKDTFTVGDWLLVSQTAAGIITIAGASGVTFETATVNTTSAKGDVVGLEMIAANVWRFIGGGGTSAATTTDLPEGTNLYYTDVRADARITAQKAQPSGLATLDAGGKLDVGQLPALAITETFVVASQAAMLALTAQEGDVAVRTDLSKSLILSASPASTLSNWQELLTPSSPVTSIFGRVGSVTAASGDYTFAQIGSKPTTLAGYGITDAQSFISAGTTAQYWRGDKTWQSLNSAAVGLGSVNNTSDTSKPVSTAQAAANALRVLKAGDSMTGPLVLPGDPTALLQAATKSYVDQGRMHIAPFTAIASTEQFATGDGTTSSAPLTISGLPLTSASVSAIHRTDWQGRQLLYATARTNLALQSQSLNTSPWGFIQTSPVAAGVSYAGVVPYWQIASTVTGGYPRIYQTIGTITAGTSVTVTLALRASASSSSAAIGVNGSSSSWGGTDGSTAAFSVLSGPGAIATYSPVALLNVTGLSTTQDTLVTITRTYGTSENVALYIYGNNYGAVAVGVGSLATRVMITSGVPPQGGYIPTTTATVTVTDYTLTGPSVAFGQVPVTGAVLDWDGTGTPVISGLFNGIVTTGNYTVATLPTGTLGMRACVTDALAPTFGATLVGGGSVVATAFFNGTNWIDA